jgi:hypothetical protein
VAPSVLPGWQRGLFECRAAAPDQRSRGPAGRTPRVDWAQWQPPQENPLNLGGGRRRDRHDTGRYFVDGWVDKPDGYDLSPGDPMGALTSTGRAMYRRPPASSSGGPSRRLATHRPGRGRRPEARQRTSPSGLDDSPVPVSAVKMVPYGTYWISRTWSVSARAVVCGVLTMRRLGWLTQLPVASPTPRNRNSSSAVARADSQLGKIAILRRRWRVVAPSPPQDSS